MTRRIFKSILIVATAVLLLSFLIIMDVLYGSFSASQREELKAELAVAARGVELNGLAFLEGLDAGDRRFTLVSPDGAVLFDSRSDAALMENHSDREEIVEAMETGSGAAQRLSQTLTVRTFYQAVKLADGTVLRIAAAQNGVLTLVLGMVTPAVIVLIAAGTISAILANRLSSRIVKPLNALDLEHPLDNEAYEELSPLLTRIALQKREIDRQVNELKRRQDEFTAVTASMNEGLVLLNEAGHILSMNPAARALFRVGADCVGRDFIAVERSAELTRALEAAVETGRGEAEFAREGRLYEINTSRITSAGKPCGTVLLAFDITERAEAEKLRREFTANVSHELKTPLQSIMGSAELMEAGLVKPGDMPVFTGRIRSEAARLVTLIDDIIRLSLLDEGNVLPEETVELADVARDAMSLLEEEAAARNVSVKLTGDGARIRGVKRLAHEAVYNLVENAIKYNVEGGSVTIDVSAMGENAVLTVSDTGIGIPPEYHSRVFERFYRVDKSHSKATGGTGLGLSIVKHAVMALHGSIALESEPGRGTRVTLTLPGVGLK